MTTTTAPEARTVQSALAGIHDSEVVGMYLQLLRDTLASRHISVCDAAAYLDVEPRAIGRQLKGIDPLSLDELHDLGTLVSEVAREQDSPFVWTCTTCNTRNRARTHDEAVEATVAHGKTCPDAETEVY